MLLIAPALSTLCAVVGLYASYYLDTASGPMVVLTNGVVFTAVYLFNPRRGVVSAGLRRWRTASDTETPTD